MPGECVVSEFRELSAEEHAETVGNTEAFGWCIGPRMIDNLDLSGLTRFQFELQLDDVFRRSERNRLPVDLDSADHGRIGLVLLKQIIAFVSLGIFQPKSSGEEFNFERVGGTGFHRSEEHTSE